MTHLESASILLTPTWAATGRKLPSKSTSHVRGTRPGPDKLRGMWTCVRMTVESAMCDQGSDHLDFLAPCPSPQVPHNDSISLSWSTAQVCPADDVSIFFSPLVVEQIAALKSLSIYYIMFALSARCSCLCLCLHFYSVSVSISVSISVSVPVSVTHSVSV